MVAALFKAGDQVPVIPLFDVVGNGVNVAPEQTLDDSEKVGVLFMLTVSLAEFEVVSPSASLITQ